MIQSNSFAEARTLCANRGWRLTCDLTERSTGAASPVLRVDASGTDAVLRFDVASDAVLAYNAFTSSGLTPQVLDQGVVAGRTWLLIEWMPGDPVSPSAPAELLEVTGIVLAAASSLQGPVDRAAAEADRGYVLNYLVQFDEKLASCIVEDFRPRLAEAVRRHWTPASTRHGDLLAPNVLLGDNGVRFIDVSGGYGPFERDAGRWTAGIIHSAYRTVGKNDAAATAEVGRHIVTEVLDAAPYLDPAGLRSWTAVALAEAANSLLLAGVNPTFALGLVFLGGYLSAA